MHVHISACNMHVTMYMHKILYRVVIIIVSTLILYSYEGACSTVDTIFGQRFHPDFPRLFRSCDLSGDLGYGMYPTTSGDLYQPGIDVEVT